MEAIGRDHYMNLYGGCASTQELEDLDGAETARLLIDSGAGEVTPYGVVYDNGMKLEQYYDGQHFPAYLYEPCMLMIGLTFRLEPEDTKNITWLYLPAAKGQLERAMVRSGITDPADMRFRFSESMFPDEVDAALDFRYENIYELNDLKKKHPDAMLLFRCGDFYETYKDDAVKASNILGITLTRYSQRKEEDGSALRMAGFPYHALDTFLPKLIRAGERVAICDQIEQNRKPQQSEEAKPEQKQEVKEVVSRQEERRHTIHR